MLFKMSIQAVVFLLFLFAVVFYAGWWACIKFHTRQAPTPLYRDACASKMSDHRSTVAKCIDAAYAEGFVRGQLSQTLLRSTNGRPLTATGVNAEPGGRQLGNHAEPARNTFHHLSA